jgi:hypothetical protein
LYVFDYFYDTKFAVVYIFIPDYDSWYIKLSVTKPASSVLSGSSWTPTVDILDSSGFIDWMSMFSKWANLSHTINIPKGYFLNEMCA